MCKNVRFDKNEGDAMKWRLPVAWCVWAISEATGVAQEPVPPEDAFVQTLVAKAPLCPCDPPLLQQDSADPCVPRIWGSVDYLMWWVRKASTPPLVVTGSAADPFPGALDQPGTQILFGNRDLDYGRFNGLRLSLGGWLDAENLFGIEGSGFALERRSVRFSARGDANGQPFLATPFINAVTGNENVYFISQNFADPNLTALLTGGVGVASSTSLWSWEINGTANLARSNAWSVDALAGFRQTSLREDFSYATTVNNIVAGGAALFLLNPVDPPFTVSTLDQFTTSNLFNGGQIGARIERRFDIFSVDLITKLAMGSMHESVTINGMTNTTAPLAVNQAVGGIFAQASNIGHYSRDVFAVIPEVNLNLGVQVTKRIKAYVGYSFVYLSNVVRPGDQIDRSINVNRVPIDFNFGTPGGPNRPAFDWHSTSFWAQGINFGVEITF
jgi:hypothetical protein